MKHSNEPMPVGYDGDADPFMRGMLKERRAAISQTLPSQASALAPARSSLAERARILLQRGNVIAQTHNTITSAHPPLEAKREAREPHFPIEGFDGNFIDENAKEPRLTDAQLNALGDQLSIGATLLGSFGLLGDVAAALPPAIDQAHEQGSRFAKYLPKSDAPMLNALRRLRLFPSTTPVFGAVAVTTGLAYFLGANRSPEHTTIEGAQNVIAASSIALGIAGIDAALRRRTGTWERLAIEAAGVLAYSSSRILDGLKKQQNIQHEHAKDTGGQEALTSAQIAERFLWGALLTAYVTDGARKAEMMWRELSGKPLESVIPKRLGSAAFAAAGVLTVIQSTLALYESCNNTKKPNCFESHPVLTSLQCTTALAGGITSALMMRHIAGGKDAQTGQQWLTEILSREQAALSRSSGWFRSQTPANPAVPTKAEPKAEIKTAPPVPAKAEETPKLADKTAPARPAAPATPSPAAYKPFSGAVIQKPAIPKFEPIKQNPIERILAKGPQNANPELRDSGAQTTDPVAIRQQQLSFAQVYIKRLSEPNSNIPRNGSF